MEPCTVAPNDADIHFPASAPVDRIKGFGPRVDLLDCGFPSQEPFSGQVAHVCYVLVSVKTVGLDNASHLKFVHCVLLTVV
jgi:hypothetical protein